MEALGYIYGLVDPRDGALRYIGQTRGALQERLSQHRCEKGNTLKCQWIRQLATLGLAPVIVEFCQCPYSELNDHEREHIAFMRAAGATLFNMTDGGQRMGLPRFDDLTPEDAAASRARQELDAHPIYGDSLSDLPPLDSAKISRQAARIDAWFARKGTTFSDWLAGAQ